MLMHSFSKGERLALKGSIQVVFLRFVIKGNIQRIHVLNDAHTMCVNTIWHAQTAGRKEHPSKMSRYLSLGTPTCIKEESKSNVLGLSLPNAGVTGY